MEPSQFVLIRWQGKAVGPFSLEQLRELAAGGALTPATEVAPEAEGPWARIETLPLGAVLFPPPPTVTFKVPDYERANRAATPPINLKDLIAAANRPLAAPPGGTAPAPPAPTSAEHDVNSLLRFNYEIDRKRGHFKLPPLPARRSRRTRDYLVLLFGIGVLIFTVLGFEAVLAVSLQVMAAQMPDQFWPILNMVLFHSPIMAWGLAAFFFYWVALTWLMFGLMDDY
jgi:hypothetical protein